jgi:orotate phosphoribosyltransferase
MSKPEALPPYKASFIRLLVQVGALRFGNFVSKAGRHTPYFIDFGSFGRGNTIARLGQLYAQAIQEQLGDAYDVLFGPAYKGIPLAVTTAAELARRGKDVGYCFNRKEAKDHGEGGLFVGQPLKDGDRVLIIEDVTTAGTSVRETVPLLLRTAKVKLAGLVVAVDRKERGLGTRSALVELSQEYGMPAFSIVDIDEVIEYLREHTIDDKRVLSPDQYNEAQAYRRAFGAG